LSLAAVKKTMRKSFLATTALVFILAILLGCLAKQQAYTSQLPGAQGSAIAQANNTPKLALPIDCSPGKDCYIMHYLDRDPGPAAVDFGCGRQTYDGHDGIDFGIPDERTMQQGVAVKAVAAGQILRVRDGVADKRVADQTDKSKVAGIECGNGVVIDHGNGWQTQYCHLRNGSIAVKGGTSVNTGTVLGMVGESGLASFPHVHLTVRYQNKAVDPFIGLNNESGCQVARQPIWAQTLDYVPTGLIRAGFAPQAPNLDLLWEGRFFESQIPGNSPALVFWVQAFGVLAGDEEQFSLIAPDGKPFVDRTQPIKASNRVWMSFVGKKASATSPLIPGLWRGEYRLVRNGKVLIDLKRELRLADG
jgi:murein DD-endopeptidase